jgi:hypothetical protein
MKTTQTLANPRGKCTKKNPRLCRLHGKTYIELTNFRKQVADREKELQFQQFTTPDFAASWKMKEEKDGTTTASVYRSGIPSAPKERKVEAGHYLRADALCPEGRQGRTDGVFASPTLGGVCRWVKGNYSTNIPDVRVRELRVDIDNTYVYSVRAWERASGWDTEEEYKKFWDTGITLRDYMKQAKTDPRTYDPQEWELLIKEENIRSVKPVGAERAASFEYSSGDHSEITKMLKSPVPTPEQLYRPR